MKKRLWMAINCHDFKTQPESKIRPITISDVPLLAQLVDVAYRGTIDYEGETLEQCAEEMKGTIEGKYGDFVYRVSTVIEIEGEAVSACLVTMYSGKPLIAFTMTNPKHQKKGLSRIVIENALSELSNLGEGTLYLVVTDGNKAAQNLYRKIGFVDIGIAHAEAPPPEFDEPKRSDP